MSSQNTGRYQKKILTIPNLLSLFRLLLVPLFCWTYLGLKNMWWTVGLLALSGLTDMADGWVARRFDMISDFGKLFDPVADKITQAAMLLCLLVTYPPMLWLFVLLAIKEITDGVTGLVVLKKTGVMLAAEWHGKLTTTLLYGTMVLHVLWQSIPSWEPIPQWLTVALVCLCLVMMLLSLVLYTVRNLRTIRDFNRQQAAEKKETTD